MISAVVTNNVAHRLVAMSRRIQTEVNLQIKKELEAVQVISAREHRYQSHSAMLNKAYRMELRNMYGRLKLTKQETNTPYAWAIHSGRRDWRNYTPDPFLYNAGQKRKPYMVTNIKNAVRRAING